MEITKECVVLGGLFVLAWMDIKKMEVSLSLVAALGVAGILFQLATNLLAWESVLGGTLVGGLLLLIAVFSRESIGVGDGVVFCATGVWFGLRDNLQLLMLASFGAALAALVLIRVKRYTRRSRIPFVPFVLAADVLLAAIR